MKFDHQWKSRLEELANFFINQPHREIPSLNRYDFPKKGGIYSFSTIDKDDCVYIGKSGDLRDRVFDVHLNGKGKSSLRHALLGLKKMRNNEVVTTEDELDEYVLNNFYLRFYVIEDILLRGCLEDYLNAMLKPIYSVSLSLK